MRWMTCILLWVAVAVSWLFPHLDLPLRALAPFGLAAAICRTAVAVLVPARPTRVPRASARVSLGAEAASAGRAARYHGRSVQSVHRDVRHVRLAGGCDVVPAWGSVVALVSALGFGWLVLDHVQAEMAEHHRLNDFPTHLFTMWLAGAAIAELVAHYVSRARGGARLAAAAGREARERALEERAPGGTDDAGGRGRPRAVDAARDHRGRGARAGTQRATGCPGAAPVSGREGRCEIDSHGSRSLSGHSRRHERTGATTGRHRRAAAWTPTDDRRTRAHPARRRSARRLRVEMSQASRRRRGGAGDGPGALVAAQKRVRRQRAAAANVGLRFAQREVMVRIEVRDVEAA